MKKFVCVICAAVFCSAPGYEVSAQANYVSEVWSPDLGDGNYKNPIIYADYSDPDVCRVGNDFYMTASSFNAVPGLPILHSKDMINWRIINHAIRELRGEGFPSPSFFDSPQHGNGVWAPSIRYHKNRFYIYYGDPDSGIYMTSTNDPYGEWEPLTLVKAGKGLIDACPFWDDDGKAYLVHAYAGSRAGIKSIIAVTRLTEDGKKAIGASKTVYDGHDLDPTIEGPKFYKRGNYYYIFAPAGGVATGWQTVLRAKNIFGPYERRVVLHQGKTAINGPHQGAWVDTPEKEDWFFHFQDVGTVGRIVHLQPMIWKDGWPVIGEDKDGDNIGEPVLTHRKPKIPGSALSNPQESDEFNSNSLGVQWQWHANPMDWWVYSNGNNGVLSLFSVPVPASYKNLWDVPNLLLQKFPAPEFQVTTKVTFFPNNAIKGERTGLLLMGLDYALLSFENSDDGLVLKQIQCQKADRGTAELTNETVLPSSNTLYLRIQVTGGSKCAFLYSVDGSKFTPIGKNFKAREGKWIGAKLGVFCSRPQPLNDGGRADFDWVRIEKIK